MLLISEGEPPGDGGTVSFRTGLALTPTEEGEDTIFWSDKAIVGSALLVDDPDDTLPIGGMRPPENLDVVDRRDAGRNGDCGPSACSGLATIESWSEGGGGGEEGGEAEVGNGCGGTSAVDVSGDAWANSLDKEDGLALGEELDRVRDARRWDDGGRAT